VYAPDDKTTSFDEHEPSVSCGTLEHLTLEWMAQTPADTPFTYRINLPVLVMRNVRASDVLVVPNSILLAEFRRQYRPEP